MIVRFTTPDGVARIGYITWTHETEYRICTAPGVYVSAPKDEVEIVK